MNGQNKLSMSDLEKRKCHPYVLKLDGYPMIPINKTPNILLIGLFVLTACSFTGESSTTPAIATASPQSTATEIRILPTPASPGDSIIWQDLQVTMDQIETTDDFITEFGSTRIPSPGMKFMWVHIQLKNVGQIEIEIPQIEHFSVLYAATELKPTYGHREKYAEYATLGPILFPNQAADGWIRFDIPATAELKDMLCVFIPESAQIGTTFSSPNYPYSEDKPTYVWKCEL
jgi:hypothetical protein